MSKKMSRKFVNALKAAVFCTHTFSLLLSLFFIFNINVALAETDSRCPSSWDPVLLPTQYGDYIWDIISGNKYQSGAIVYNKVTKICCQMIKPRPVDKDEKHATGYIFWDTKVVDCSFNITGDCPIHWSQIDNTIWHIIVGRKETINTVVKNDAKNTCCKIVGERCVGCVIPDNADPNSWVAPEKFLVTEVVDCPTPNPTPTPGPDVNPVVTDDCPRQVEYLVKDWIYVKTESGYYIVKSKTNRNLCCKLPFANTVSYNNWDTKWPNCPCRQSYSSENPSKIACPKDDVNPPKPNNNIDDVGGCENLCFEKYEGPKETESYRIYFAANKYDKPENHCDYSEWLRKIKAIYTDNAPKGIDRIIVIGGTSMDGNGNKNATLSKQRADFVKSQLQSVAPANEISKLTDCNGSPDPNCSEYALGSSSAYTELQYSKAEDCKNRVVYVHVSFKQNRLKMLIESVIGKRDVMVDNASVWKNAKGNFNGARLASDLTAGVVLGTVGGLITSSVVKKHQLENGFEDVMCFIGGQPVAQYGDEFTVGIK